MKFTKLVTVCLSGVLLVGCGTTDLKEKVAEQNYKTDRALSLYEDSKSKGADIKNKFVEGLDTQNDLVFSTVTLSHNVETSNKLVETLTSVMYDVDNYIDSNNEYVTITLEDGDEPVTDMITDTGDFVTSLLEEKYFLDDTTGTVEQMLLIELPSGVVTGMSVYWLGGVIYDVKKLG